MRKYEIAALLAERCGFTSYLEICTPTTGATYARVDTRHLTRRVRLMYRCPADFSDGAPIDDTTPGPSGEALFAKLLATGERFDLVFVDPFHTYECSLRDLTYALQLVTKDGIVLVHDCNPPHAACAGPEFRSGEWCGVTFAAFLDIVLFASGLHYATVDSDYGCGIMSRRPWRGLDSGLRVHGDLIARWRNLGLNEKYGLLENYRSELLRLISPDAFQNPGPEHWNVRILRAFQALRLAWLPGERVTSSRRWWQPAH